MLVGGLGTRLIFSVGRRSTISTEQPVLVKRTLPHCSTSLNLLSISPPPALSNWPIPKSFPVRSLMPDKATFSFLAIVTV